VVEKKFDELVRLIHRYDVESLDSGVSPDSPVFVQSQLPGILDMTFPIDPRQKDKALAQMAATTIGLPSCSTVPNEAPFSLWVRPLRPSRFAAHSP
jgi:hypothetical protein